MVALVAPVLQNSTRCLFFFVYVTSPVYCVYFCAIVADCGCQLTLWSTSSLLVSCQRRTGLGVCMRQALRHSGIKRQIKRIRTKSTNSSRIPNIQLLPIIGAHKTRQLVGSDTGTQAGDDADLRHQKTDVIPYTCASSFRPDLV